MGIQQALVTVTGNLGANPVSFSTSANVPACSFRLGVTPRFFDQGTGQWRDRDTTWVSVCAYRGLAKNILGSLGKGDPVIVTGTMRTERWQKEGVDRMTPVIDAAAVGPDLSQGVATFARLSRRQPGVNAGAGADGGTDGNGVTGAGMAGAGAPANPLNPAIPPNPASVTGVVIDTDGVGGGDGGAAAAAAGTDTAAGGVDGATAAGGMDGAATAAVDPATGEMGEPDEPDDFGDPAM